MQSYLSSSFYWFTLIKLLCGVLSVKIKKKTVSDYHLKKLSAKIKTKDGGKGCEEDKHPYIRLVTT